ncbi:MAG: serine hydroxymethyltransferase [Puniceicoccales bacterium]|jgi:glycine hydroxymethyltransferase|nr:serine hydroxymethyltransferase [Puniceicoccales bacterium]
MTSPLGQLSTVDPAIASMIEGERQRQRQHIELIASENFTSPAVIEAVGSILTNKYAEGYPQKRYYGGCEFVDQIESLAIERAQQLFHCEHANVQPHSGSQANTAVYLACLKPGDKILTMSLEHGGHLSHGYAKNISGMLFEVTHYGVSDESGEIDYDQLESIANGLHPKMITVGASAYSRTIDFERVGTIAKNCGALLMADIAHIAGLVATGLHPTPVPYADFVTTTTHKTLRGPRGGMILCKKEWAKSIDSAVFPGTQGGPLMHVIAGKAVCFLEDLRPEFKEYQRQILNNCKTLCNAMEERGFHIVSHGTDNHLFLIDLRPTHPEISGKDAQIALERANITLNKNTVPHETRSPFQGSGLRIGTPALTTRGMKEKEMLQIANFMEIILKDITDEKVIENVQKQAIELCAKFPLPH